MSDNSTMENLKRGKMGLSKTGKEGIKMRTQEKGRLSLGEKIAYGFGDCGANVYVAMGMSFLTAFYTDTMGLAAAAVGTMMLITRVFDGITDLIMGAIVDRTKSKYGKARPWLLWTAPLMFIGFLLLFYVPESFGQSQKLVYAYVTYIFTNCIVYTANNLPYNALLSRMTLNVQDRATTASIRFIMTQITSLIINAVTASVLASVGWFKLAVIYGIVMVVMLLISFFGCKEHIGADEGGSIQIEEVPLRIAFPALLKNKYFYLQALLFIVLYINTVAQGSLGFYFYNNVLGNLAIMSIASFAQTIPAVLSNFANPQLVQKFGKRKVMMVGSGMMIAGSILIGLAGVNLPLIMLGIVVKGFGSGPIMSGVFAMTADVVDYGEWKTGVRSEGLVNSCTSFGMKVGIGLGSAVGSWILALGGYDGTAAVQSASALNAIRFGFGYFGAILAVVCLLIIFAMNIDKHIKQIQIDLEMKHDRKA